MAEQLIKFHSNVLLLIIFICLFITPYSHADQTIQPPYSIDRALLPILQPQVYATGKTAVTGVFDVPMDNAIASDKLTGTDAVTLISFNEKTLGVNYKIIAENMVSGTGADHLPIFSEDTIGYYQASVFGLLNLKTKQCNEIGIAGEVKYDINLVGAVNTAENIFIFHLLNFDAEDQDLIRIIDYDDKFTNSTLISEKIIDSKTIVGYAKDTVFYINKNEVKMMDINFNEIDHPFSKKFNREKDEFSNITEIQMHPDLPFAVFSDNANENTWIISWHDKTNPEIQKIFNKQNTLNYRFSYDGKWLQFQTYDDYLLMPVNPDLPHFIGSPILLGAIPSSPGGKGTSAMTRNPSGFVVSENKCTNDLKRTITLKKWNFAKADYMSVLLTQPNNSTPRKSEDGKHVGRQNKVIQHLSDTIRLDPNDATALFNRGLFRKNKGAYDQALGDFNNAIRIDPDLAGAYFNRGLIRDNHHEYDQALQDFNKVIHLYPDYAPAYYYRGLTSKKQGEHDKAIEDFSKAILLDPEHALAWFNRGLYLEKNNRAIEDLTKALNLDPSNAAAYYHRGIAWNKRGTYNETTKEFNNAVEDLTKAIALDPHNANIYINRGITLNSLSMHNKAIEDFNQAIQLEPDNALAYFNRGKIWNSAGDHNKAIEDFSSTIQLDPNNALAYYTRGKIWETKGEHDKAVQDFDKAIQLNPKSVAVYKKKIIQELAEAIRLNPEAAITYYNQGLFWEKEGQHYKAIQDFNKAIQIDPNYAFAYLSRGKAWCNKTKSFVIQEYNNAIEDFNKAKSLNKTIKIDKYLAIAYFKRGKTWIYKGESDKAIKDFNKAKHLDNTIHIDNDLAIAYFNRGHSWDTKGEQDKAIQDYSKAIQLDYEYVMAYMNRSRMLEIKGAYDKAIEDLTKAIHLEPNDVSHYQNRGRIRGKMGMHDEAIEDLSKAIQLNDHDKSKGGYIWEGQNNDEQDKGIKDFNKQKAKPYYNRGKLWQMKGEYDKAIQDFNNFIQLAPGYAVAYNDRGLIWKNKGKYDKAIQDYNRSIQIDSKNAYVYKNRGNVWVRKGEYDKALKDYSKAIRLDPGNPLAYFCRGTTNFYSNRYGAASKDFLSGLMVDSNKQFTQLLQIWHHITVCKLGNREDSTLANFRKTMPDSDWIAPVVRMFLNEITPEACLKAAAHSDAKKEKEQKCEAYFYVGQYYLLEKDKARAKKLFLECLTTKVEYFLEYDAAKKELERL